MERLDADPYYEFSDEYFDALRRGLGTDLHLATVTADGVIVAAGLFTTSCGIVELHLAGWAEEAAHHRPTKLLYHGVRAWAKRRGDRWFHLGGGLGSSADSLMHFKAGFSPVRLPYDTLRCIVLEDEYLRLMDSRGLDAQAPDLAGYFPAYRRQAP
jgi:hypothetical protein